MMADKETRFASAMRQNERKHFRNEDLQAGVDFETALKLGCFDREFMYFVTAYSTPKGLACRISAKEHLLQRFVQDALEEGLYPTPVKRYIRRLPAPSGEEAAIKARVKKEAARQIFALYDETYFQALAQLTATQESDSAWPLLRQWQEALEGIYNREWLDLYQGLLYTALESKVLSVRHYLELKGWLKTIDKQLEDDIIPKSQYKKTMAAFAYTRDDIQWQYFFDARLEAAVNKREALEMARYQVTPILVRTRYLSDMSQFPAMRASFQADYQAYCEQGYLDCYQQIKQLPSVITKEAFAAWEATVAANCTQEAQAALGRYKRRWNL